MAKLLNCVAAAVAAGSPSSPAGLKYKPSTGFRQSTHCCLAVATSTANLPPWLVRRSQYCRRGSKPVRLEPAVLTPLPCCHKPP
ncbi:hypothetical protein NPIL_24971 [Nephila pilipes]|uniref:Uncharacterized protein n=1 Tax=Nephila pilipes TaxID=299642 RepID=A0A8X6TVM1_NEPPI|nr:hypothetical protein NPIL_24971 [Nephila pilipes]